MYYWEAYKLVYTNKTWKGEEKEDNCKPYWWLPKDKRRRFWNISILVMFIKNQICFYKYEFFKINIEFFFKPFLFLEYYW